MDLPTEYRARMMGAAVDALSAELRDLRLPVQTAMRVVDLLDQLRMNAAAIAMEADPAPCLWRPDEPIRSTELPETNVILLQRPA